MVEHSTSVFAKPPIRQQSTPQSLNMHYTPGKPYNLCCGPTGEKKEDGDGSESREDDVEGMESSNEGTRMPVTGTLTSTVFYRKSTKCEELIYRPQPAEMQSTETEKESAFPATQSESLYDKVKREVENHRKARQLAKDREKELDDRQRQLQNSKLCLAKMSTSTNNRESVVTEPAKLKVVKKPLTAPPKEAAPPNLGSTSTRLAKALLPGQSSKNSARNISESLKTVPSKSSRLNVIKQRPRKDEAVEDENPDLG